MYFALCDVNNFYVSAEQVFRPDWRGKPMIVLSNNDGTVVAANRQAKACGVEKFQPFFEVRELCDQRGVIAVSSNYELYADLSMKLMQVLSRFAPEQMVYSCDESFLKFDRCHHAIDDWHEYMNKIRQTAWKLCRLPISIGLGTTLTLAKAASFAAKKLQGYNGICVLDTAEKCDLVLRQMPVSEVWGIGRRLTEHLKHMGITTAFQLARKPPALMRKAFNVEVERVVRELNGERCKVWDSVRADKQQIFSTRSAGQRITDQESLRQALCTHAGIASRKARQQGSLCKVMMAFAANSPFDSEASFAAKAIHRFSFPTADVTQLSSVASQLADQLFKEDVRFYKFGIGLLDLVDGRHEQADLFNPSPNDRALMAVFDGLNSKYGTDTVFIAGQGIKTKWEMRRERLTPQYTTNWHDLPLISCQ